MAALLHAAHEMPSEAELMQEALTVARIQRKGLEREREEEEEEEDGALGGATVAKLNYRIYMRHGLALSSPTPCAFSTC